LQNTPSLTTAAYWFFFSEKKESNQTFTVAGMKKKIFVREKFIIFQQMPASR